MKLHQSYAREEGAALATGAILSFMDADDSMTVERVEVTKRVFARMRPRLFLHGMLTCVPPRARVSMSLVGARNGKEMYWKAGKAIQVSGRWALPMRVAHGHLAINATVLRTVPFPKCNATCAEDANMVSNVINYFGPHPETVVVLGDGLIVYKPRSMRKQHPRPPPTCPP